MSDIKLQQSCEILKGLIRVSEPKTQEYYDDLWKEYRKHGSVQSRKNTKRYAREVSK